MTAIIVGSAPHPLPVFARDPADYMPFSSRMFVAAELNRLWREFVTEMHDGPTFGQDVAEKFWKYVLAGG